MVVVYRCITNCETVIAISETKRKLLNLKATKDIVERSRSLVDIVDIHFTYVLLNEQNAMVCNNLC